MATLPEQIRELSSKPMGKGRFGLYWMQAAQRAHWNHADWLPTLSASGVREPAHRAFPKVAEDWDLERKYFVKVMPTEYKRALARLAEEQNIKQTV